MEVKREDKLPDVIKIDDITSGKIDPQLIYNEIERLKVEINILRNDMALFTKALATIGPNQSQQQYYKVITQRLKTVQNSIQEYCTQYNMLLPVINLSQIKLGNEVERLPQLPTHPGASTTGLNGKVVSSANTNSNGSKASAPQQNNHTQNENSQTTDMNGDKNGTNAAQPIVL